MDGVNYPARMYWGPNRGKIGEVRGKHLFDRGRQSSCLFFPQFILRLNSKICSERDNKWQLRIK